MNAKAALIAREIILERSQVIELLTALNRPLLDSKDEETGLKHMPEFRPRRNGPVNSSARSLNGD